MKYIFSSRLCNTRLDVFVLTATGCLGIVYACDIPYAILCLCPQFEYFGIIQYTNVNDQSEEGCQKSFFAHVSVRSPQKRFGVNVAS